MASATAIHKTIGAQLREAIGGMADELLQRRGQADRVARQCGRPEQTTRQDDGSIRLLASVGE